MPYTKKKNRLGFTLVELFLVSVILSIISLAIYSTLNNGIKIWQKINIETPGEGLNIFLERFCSDLRNSFNFSNIDLLGQEDMLEFPTLVNSPRLNKRTVGQVVYSYNSMSGTLNREQRDFSQIYREETGRVVQLLKNIKSLKFRYYFYDTEMKEYFWLDEWQKENLPLAVRVQLELNDTGTIRFTKTVSIPAGG